MLKRNIQVSIFYGVWVRMQMKKKLPFQCDADNTTALITNRPLGRMLLVNAHKNTLTVHHGLANIRSINIQIYMLFAQSIRSNCNSHAYFYLWKIPLGTLACTGTNRLLKVFRPVSFHFIRFGFGEFFFESIYTQQI